MSLSSTETSSDSEYGRTPPQDLVAEQSVLGGMMLSKDAIADCVEVLRGIDFYRPAHEAIYDAIIDLYGRGEPADAVTVSDLLTKRGEITRVGGPAYLHTLLQSVPTAANAGFYAEIVRERAVLRRLVDAGTKIVQLGYSQDGEVDAIVNEAQAEVYKVAERRTAEDYVALRDIIEGTVDEIEAAGSRSEGVTGVPTGFYELDELTQGLHGGQMIVIAARPAVGKALALDTPIPTPTGWTTMGEVNVGDEVLAADGTPTIVTAATEVMDDRPCFEVEFNDGSVIVADAEHQWLTSTRADRRHSQSAESHGSVATKVGTIRTTAEILKTLRCDTADARLNHAVPTAKAIKLADAALPVAPYTLGIWLGDGASAASRITTADPEVVARIVAEGYTVTPVAGITYAVSLPQESFEFKKNCVVCGVEFTTKVRHVRSCSQSCGGKARFVSDPVPKSTCIDCGVECSGGLRCEPCRLDHGSLQAILRRNGLLNNKHIPMEYLRSSEAQRRALLAGLLDSDGTVSSSGCPQFAVTSLTLATDFRELVHSLGYRTGWSEKHVNGHTEESSICFVITFATSDTVFALERKRQLHVERDAKATSKRTSRFISDVRAIASVQVRCIQVAHEDHLFLAGKSFIPTHNSTFALDFARSASIKHNMTSVFFSLEMGRNEIAMRLLSAEASIALQNLRKGSIKDEEWSKIATTMGRLNDAPLFIDDSPNMSLMEIRAKCRRLKQKHDLKLIMLDYLQLMSSGKRVESRQQEVSEFSRSLKLLAKELDVPLIALSQLNRGSEQRTDKKPMVSDLRESGCLTAETKVLRSDTGAETTMGELFATGAKDVPVWSLDANLRYVERHLTHVFSTGVKPVYKMTLASGRTIRATDNHPFFTYEGWQALGDLQAGDRLGIPRHVDGPSLRTDWDEEQIATIARFIGNAPVANETPVDNDDPAMLGDLLKFIPEEIFALPKASIALFLSQLWATTGIVSVNGTSGKIQYRAHSRKLADDIARLLLRFGITCKISQHTTNTCVVEIVGDHDQKRFLQGIGVEGEHTAAAQELLDAIITNQDAFELGAAPIHVWNNVREILEQNPNDSKSEGSLKTAVRQPLSRVAEVLDDAQMQVEAINDIFWDNIVSIEADGEEEVFDATVIGNHNFIANGIAVHNSIEQDADMVILLHREDIYDKESARAGEADVIVAKHRNGPTKTIVLAFQGHYSRFNNMAQEGGM